jgi:hypothetical protein
MGTLELTESQETSIEQASETFLNKYTIPDHGHHYESESTHRIIKTKKIVTNSAVVLENATHGFKKPNILDCKLGIRLWADDAHDEKKVRFDKITELTTHKELGFAVAGMRVWQGHDVPQHGDIDRHGFKIYDKSFGRMYLNKDNAAEAFHNFIFPKSAGIDEELGRYVVQAFLADLQEIQRIMENQESRMYSASLLFVFEGDGEALRAAMEEASKTPPRMNGVNGNGNDNSSSDDDEDDEDDEDFSQLPKIYSLKVIDFAHAQWVPGQGPDENALQGVRSLVRILKGIERSSGMR